VSKKVKLERPRPLKIGGGTQPELGVEDLLVVVENVRRSLAGAGLAAPAAQTNFDLKNQLEVLTANLKISGPALERSHKNLMDKLNHALMSACRLERFPLMSRLHMLELLELRSMDWQSNVTLDNYYKQKLAQIEVESKPQQSQTAPVLGSVVNPFQASFQDEGKEINKPELQSVREEKDNNNVVTTASPPIPEEIRHQGKKFFVSIKIRSEELTISGGSMDLVKTAKIVLNEFFNQTSSPEEEMEPEVPADVSARRGYVSSPTMEMVKPDITYNKEQLLEIAKSSMCKNTPESWDVIAKELPGVVRRPQRAGPTSKLILREMEGLRKQEQAKHV